MALTQFQKDLLKKFVDKQFEEADADTQTFDIEAEMDSSLSYSENKVKIGQRLKELGIITIEREVSKKPKQEIEEEEDRHELQQAKEEEKKIEEEHKKALAKLKKSTPDINKYFRIPRGLIMSFLSPKNAISGFLFESGAGLGKSYQVHDIFRHEKRWETEKDFAILSGYLTPMKLYAFLYKYRNTKAILFDDIAKMFSDDTSRGLLLSALWSITDKRIIHYLSTSEKLVDDEGERIPSNFILDAKIIWCMNRLPSELENIKSRCYFYQLNFSHKTKIKIIHEICKSEKIPMEIAEYISENTNEAYDVDFRLPLKLFGLQKTNPSDWKELAKAILKPNEELILIKQLLGKHSTVSEAIAEFVKETGRSRATFFRKKKMLVQNIFMEEDSFVEVGSNPKVSKSQKISQKKESR